jgi:hypothetical protein
MPTGLYDIRDREPVLHPDEIEAGRVLCEQQGLQYIAGPDGRAIPLAAYIGRLTKRWQRAVQTGQQMLRAAGWLLHHRSQGRAGAEPGDALMNAPGRLAALAKAARTSTCLPAHTMPWLFRPFGATLMAQCVRCGGVFDDVSPGFAHCGASAIVWVAPPARAQARAAAVVQGSGS